MTGTEIEDAMRLLVDHLVDRVPGVTGALISSTDGFVLTARLPNGHDPAGVAAMSAAARGLSHRLVGLTGPAPVTVSHHRSATGQVLVFDVAQAAVLTVLAAATADATRLELVGQEVSGALVRLLTGRYPG